MSLPLTVVPEGLYNVVDEYEVSFPFEENQGRSAYLNQSEQILEGTFVHNTSQTDKTFFGGGVLGNNQTSVLTILPASHTEY